MAKSYEGECQLCGAWDMLTDDHIPQKSLYPKEHRSKIVKFNAVKACSKCNNGAKHDDELLKVLIGNIAQSFWGGDLWKSTIRTLENNRKLERDLEESSRHEEIINQSGKKETVKILKLEGSNKAKFLSAMERIAKGLFYQEFNEVLVETRNISIYNPDVIHPEKLKYIQSQFNPSRWRSVNGNTCIYVFTELDNGDVDLYIDLYSSIRLYYVIQRNTN